MRIIPYLTNSTVFLHSSSRNVFILIFPFESLWAGLAVSSKLIKYGLSSDKNTQPEQTQHPDNECNGKVDREHWLKCPLASWHDPCHLFSTLKISHWRVIVSTRLSIIHIDISLKLSELEQARAGSQSATTWNLLPVYKSISRDQLYQVLPSWLKIHLAEDTHKDS